VKTMKNKMMKKKRKNMMKKRWLYSSRNSTSSEAKEDLSREIRKRSLDQRECATIVARVGISLPNVHMRGKKKTITRKRNFTKAIRKTRNSQRSPTNKLMSVKNGTQAMRVPSQKLMTWQP
jgi:DUF917 family protein